MVSISVHHSNDLHTSKLRINFDVYQKDLLLTEVSDYLGYIAFGSEAYDSASNVTFFNKHLSIDLLTA